MSDKIGRNALTLGAHQAITLARPRGLRLASCRGELWVTVDGELDDIILQPGETYTAHGNTPIVVSALNDEAVLQIRATREPARSPLRDWLSWWDGPTAPHSRRQP